VMRMARFTGLMTGGSVRGEGLRADGPLTVV